MEAVPRLPMLSFELKQCPEYVDFGPVLKQYIKTHYGEDPAHYNKACSDLEQLRQSAIHVSHDFMGCSTLKKYYAQLQFLQGRFPMGEDGECNINFTWEDVFLGREVTIPDVKFEQACVLYNIGALHSVLGSIETRQNADGMKVSCTHFQCAAWAFEYLRDHFGSSNLSVDMSHEVLTFQVSLMLAQAQECILEKSMIDSRKFTITAKVAAQVTEFYRGVIRGLQAENMDAILGSRQYKEWKKRAELKILFYEVITNYYMGKYSEEQEKFGECVAYYTLAVDKLKDCAKMAKSESSDIQDSLRFMNDVVSGKYQSAKKDNDFVYHDKIPAADSLPEVKGASLVKGIPFNWNDPDVSGSDIFQKLVPMSAHEASSLYSEEKAKLLRQIGGEIEEKNVALLQFMSSLNLDPAKLNFEPERLPQDLLEKCAAVSVRPNAIKDLTDAMGAVSNSATEVQMAIDEINGLIENDIKEDEEFQKQFGKRTSNPMLPEIKKECSKFEEGHKKGNQSNIDLHKAMNAHITNLKLLAGPLEDIKNYLPSLERDKDPETEAIVRDLQKLLNKVEEMKGQRNMLEEQFRSQVKDDDITNRIVAQDGSSNTTVMFGEQIKKHDKQIELIRQNLNAQDNILRALTDANARYANTRRATAETLARRETTIGELKNSYDVYEDLLAKSQKGLDFYKKLESNINRLLERCRGICKQQAEERKQIQDRLKPREPPSRPAVSKPNTPQAMNSADTGYSSLPGLPMPNAGPSGPIGPLPDLHSSLPGFEGPKLKDYLPFMKPKTFGKKGTGSLPSSGVSSPVHVPQAPDSVPGSPLHGMSDEDLRRLGISDPKVLAMIKAHSLPSSDSSTTVPGSSGPQRSQTDQMMGMRHPSPSQSPNMMSGAPVVPGGVPAAGVRFDRSTKPSIYPQNVGSQDPNQMPQRMMQPGLPQQGFGPIPPGVAQPSGPMPSQQAMYHLQASQQGYVAPNGSGSQVQANYSPSLSGRPQHQQNMVQPPRVPAQSVINPVVSYPSPAQSPQIQSGHFTNVPGQAGQTSQQSQLPPRQSTSQTGNYRQDQDQLPMGSSSAMNIPTNSQGGQFVPAGHPAQSGIAPPVYGETYRNRGIQMPPQRQPMSQPATSSDASCMNSQVNSSLSGLQNYQQIYNVPSSHDQTYQNPQQSQGHDMSGLSYSQQPPVNSMSGGYQHQQRGQGQMPKDDCYSQLSDARNLSGPIPMKSQATTATDQQIGQGQFLQYPQTTQTGFNLPTSQQSGYVSNQGQTLTSQGQGQTLNTSNEQNFSNQMQQFGQKLSNQNIPTQQQFPQNVGQGKLHQGQSQMGQYQGGQQYQPPQQQSQISYQQQFTPAGQPQSLAQARQSPYQVQSSQPGTTQQQTTNQQGQMTQPNQQQIYSNQGQGQLTPSGSYTSNQAPATSSQEQMFSGTMLSTQPQGQVGQLGQISGQQMLPQQQQAKGQPGYVAQPSVQHNQYNQPDGRSPSPAIVQQGGHLPQQQINNVAGPLTGQVRPQVMPTGQQSFGKMSQYQQPPQAGQQPGQVGQQGPPQSQPNLRGQQISQIRPQPQHQHQFQPGQQGPSMGHLPPQQSIRPQVPHSTGQYGSFTSSQPQQQQSLRPQVPQSLAQQSPGQIYSMPQSSQSQSQPQQFQGQNQSFVLPPQQQSQQYQGQNVGPSSSFTMPQSQGSFQQQISQSTQGPQTGGSFQHQQRMPQPHGQNVPPQHHYTQTGSFAGQTGPSQVHPQVPMSSATSRYPTASPQTGQVPAGGWPGNQSTASKTGTPQASYSGTIQQLNPLSPPDVLPQPILPSPIKPDVQSSLQDVTIETPIPNQEMHPRARESPVVNRKQPEKTHSRSNSNTSQSDFKLARKHSSSSIGSSLDDILSSSPTDSTHEPPSSVLTPKVLTAQEIAQQKEEALMKGTLGRQVSKDPYPDSTKMDKFVAETEKLAKFVESLSKATCSGPSHLDIAWKEIIEDHDIHGKKHSMAIGRCYPMKNRDQDVLPFDETRVLLTSHKDDYINASWINDLAESCPKFIATQAPLHSSLFDFWLMVYEQGSEVIVMLSSDVESKDTKKYPEYWPPEKGKPTHHGPITLTLQSYKDCQLWTERIIHLQHQETKQGRTIVQLQYKNWPVSGFPEKVHSLLQFIHEVHTFYKQQRSLLKPVMVHCSNGIGRTGTFLMIYTGMQEIDHGNGIINVQLVARKMLQQRRYIIREKSQLKFCYEAILYHAQDILGKQGILVHKASFGGKLPQPGEKSYQWTPTDDVIFGSTCSISDLKSNVEKMGFNLGISGQQSSPKKDPSVKQEVSTKEVEKDPRSFSPLNTGEQKNEGTFISSLPDVVQRTDPTRQLVEGDKRLSGSLSGSNASLLSIGSEPEKMTGLPIQKVRSREASPKPGSFPGSHEGSPKLQSLLDPNTFSIGTDSGKKKITKLSFMEKTSSLSDNVEAGDPLSSLDPLWSLKK